MRSDVTLRLLDRTLLTELLHAAVEDADPLEVMPPVEGPGGPDGWTPERRSAFVRFHESRSLAADPVETTFAIAVSGRVVGAARLCPVEKQAGTAEAGVWIGRSHRGVGVGGAVLELLLEQARAAGFTSVYVSTEPHNTAVRALLAGIGVDLVPDCPDGDALTARVDLTAEADVAQEARYRALDETVSRLYVEGRLGDALKAVQDEAPRIPRRRADTAHLAACLLTLTGRPEDALAELRTALADGAWWSPAILVDDDDLAAVRDLDGFAALLRESTARHASATGVPLPPVVRRPQGTPRGVLVVLHGADQDAALAAEQWAPAVDAGFVLVAVDSSQRSTPLYRSWPDTGVGIRDITAALAELDEADNSLPLLAAGFSAGARVAVLWALSDVAVRPSGFLALGPALTPAHLDGERRVRAAQRAVRGRILVGEQDDDVTPGVFDAHEVLTDAGADVTLETVPDLGHDIPADFARRLPVLLDSLLAARPRPAGR
ncbi:GNAT family N-acetyltransferase [Streptomyces sp. NPDC020898]|uniref:GNAT family N-acetyltransferase n=1 Tax=Streptomyces sp. NPDC020898 TaxID=3365101 RepID=UPI00378BEA56